MRDAWVLRLKDDSKEHLMSGEYYFNDNGEGSEYLTQDINKATIFDDKESAEEEFKHHERAIFKRFGPDAICDFGYTNIMKHFEFAEVEVIEKD